MPRRRLIVGGVIKTVTLHTSPVTGALPVAFAQSQSPFGKLGAGSGGTRILALPFIVPVRGNSAGERELF